MYFDFSHWVKNLKKQQNDPMVFNILVWVNLQNTLESNVLGSNIGIVLTFCIELDISGNNEMIQWFLFFILVRIISSSSQNTRFFKRQHVKKPMSETSKNYKFLSFSYGNLIQSNPVITLLLVEILYHLTVYSHHVM